MTTSDRHRGSVFLVVVFAIALMATITMGILQMSTEELAIVSNEQGAAEARATAEAGLNAAFAQIRATGAAVAIPSTGFNGGTYEVTVEGSGPDPNLISTGVSSQGYTARLKAEVKIGTSAPYVIQIDNLRVNE
jgi:Tfp pilus assembly protein PilX